MLPVTDLTQNLAFFYIHLKIILCELTTKQVLQTGDLQSLDKNGESRAGWQDINDGTGIWDHHSLDDV